MLELGHAVLGLGWVVLGLGRAVLSPSHDLTSFLSTPPHVTPTDQAVLLLLPALDPPQLDSSSHARFVTPFTMYSVTNRAWSLGDGGLIQRPAVRARMALEANFAGHEPTCETARRHLPDASDRQQIGAL